MKKIITCVVMCLLVSMVAGQSQRSNTSAGKQKTTSYAVEKEAASRWLAENVADSVVQRLSLKAMRQTDEWVLFCDENKHGFVLVAKQAYWQYLSRPVLAYSTERTYGLEGPPLTLLMYYARRLDAIASLGITPASEAGKGMYVAPLLGQTAWGQTTPYNNACAMRDGKRTVTGCLAVAVGQMMRYYKYPANMAWDTMRDSYQTDDKTAQPVAALLAGLGNALQAQYGKQVTSTSLDYLKPVMVLGYGYSPRLTVHHHAQQSTVHDGIRSELQAGRPVLAANKEHAFVVDGCDGQFLHLNLGWVGYCNGWYDPLEVDELSDAKPSERLIASIVTGFAPQGEERRKEVEIEHSGELKELLSEEEQLTVTHLTVRGKLGSEDVALLRRMAGHVDAEQPLMPVGSLTHLDLSEVHWVNDQKPFYRERMQGTTTIQMTYVEYEVSENAGQNETNRTTSKYGIDLSKPVSDKDWEKFEEVTGITDGMSFHRDAQGYVWTWYTTFAHTISPMMFRECSSLREVVLPVDTRLIGQGAFVRCECLERIDIPAKVTRIGKQAFSFCTSLEEFRYHKKSLSVESPNFEKTPRKLQYNLIK